MKLNFWLGIITSYTVEAIPVDLLWFEVLLYDSMYNEALLQATVEFQEAAEGDDYANLVFQITPTSTFVGFIYAKPITRPPIFQIFYTIPSIGALANSTIGTVWELAQVFDGPAEGPLRYGFTSNSTAASNDVLKTFRNLSSTPD